MPRPDGVYLAYEKQEVVFRHSRTNATCILGYAVGVRSVDSGNAPYSPYPPGPQLTPGALRSGTTASRAFADPDYASRDELRLAQIIREGAARGCARRVAGEAPRA